MMTSGWTRRASLHARTRAAVAAATGRTMAVDASGISQAGAASRAQVGGAIRQAAGATGTSFQYLLATAKMESNFNPRAAAPTSSARGLFQFIDQTWLGTVKEAGGKLGYGQYADAITRLPSGTYSVSDPAARSAIMALRNDPVAASAMAGVLTQSNSFKLTGAIGRRPTDSELYMAHFMGVGGASKLINAAQDRPNASGAAMFPRAAAANRSIFYDGDGQARSVAGVYNVLTQRYANAADAPATRSVMAAAGIAPIGAVTASTGASYLAGFPDIRAVAPVVATASSPEATSAAPGEPLFKSMFQVGARSEPVSPTVRDLWGNTASITTAAASAQPAVRAPQRLDLFSDRAGAFSG